MKGRVVAGFHVQSCIGRGVLGQTWTAYRHAEKTWFVLKFPRWKRVAKIIKGDFFKRLRIGHPQILDCAGAGADKKTGGAMVAFPYISRNLFSVVTKKQRLKPRTATMTLKVLLKILGSVEKRGYAHGLLTPNNLLIDRKGNLVITDMSLGEIVRELDMGAFLNHVQRRPDNGCPEPLHFLSPARRLGSEASIREDLHSVGCLFYYMMTGTVGMDRARGEELHESIPVELARVILALTDPDADIDCVSDAWALLASVDMSNLRYAQETPVSSGQPRTPTSEVSSQRVPRTQGADPRRLRPLRTRHGRRSPTRMARPAFKRDTLHKSPRASGRIQGNPDDPPSGQGWPTRRKATSSGAAWGGDPTGSAAFPGLGATTKKFDKIAGKSPASQKKPEKKKEKKKSKKKGGYGAYGQWGTSLPPTWGENDS